MLCNEIASILDTPNRTAEWANAVSYKNTLTTEDKEISAAMDAWAREVGKTGYDRDHEIAALIVKSITPEVVTTPSELISAMFNESGIGEFDDTKGQKSPKNTIKVYETTHGANVDRSFIDFSYLTPSWKTLGAETDISYAELRRNGFKTVASLVTFIQEAIEAKKTAMVLSAVDAAILSDAPGYVNEASSAPTTASVNQLAVYLKDVSDGEMPLMVGLNKYVTAIAGLSIATTYLTDQVKNQYNTTGVISQVAGCKLMGLTGQKKLATGELIMPDKRILGIAGKIGECVTRGETQVYETMDNNNESVHIKVNGYTFGTMYTDISKVGKMVLA